ncbi:MAG: DUF5330 domain-containing protein [Parvibaculaceae bacterium]
MRIVRTIVLLAVAAYFLPSPPEDRLGASLQASDTPPATEFISAAVSTVADMSGFCTRQATVCDTAHYLAAKLEGKAKYGIELLYEWAHESDRLSLPLSQSQQAQGGETRGMTATTDDAEPAGRNTLQLEDLIPEWRAPAHQS